MRKNQNHNDQEHNTEILKAVAQAWHGRSSSSKSSTTTSEFDAHRLYFKGRPSRFKLEAMNMAAKKEQCGTSWDFGQSLWDSYEILAVSKKLETGLVLDNPYSSASNEQGHGVKKRKESKNSLRNLFSRVSSRRFSQADLPSEGD
ncbi:uncharacterized protein LOC105157280 [Sesamum indicum]|uniref:Uncharacterized protein LOC105157280 n=1 Tax=Sesamum indicum TaxID=4182 RepID=A0A6I9SWN1_SESIN|nr:uncharacterized protein LOC105157280 [Sesamum indicum]